MCVYMCITHLNDEFYCIVSNTMCENVYGFRKKYDGWKKFHMSGFLAESFFPSEALQKF